VGAGFDERQRVATSAAAGVEDAEAGDGAAGLEDGGAFEKREGVVFVVVAFGPGGVAVEGGEFEGGFGEGIHG